MNKKVLEILNRTLKEKFPFIEGIEFSERNRIIVGRMTINLKELSNMFPNEKVDFDYLINEKYQISNPFHAFKGFRENDLTINNMVRTIVKSVVGITMESIVYHID
jgi:hypothetical protein